MKSKLFFSGLVSLFLISGVFASEGGDHSEHMKGMKQDSMKGKAESSAIEVGNEICPVTGLEIETMGDPVKYEHEGKIYNFCCEMCVKSFKEDPEKYIKIIEESKDMDMKGSHGKVEHKNMKSPHHGHDKHMEMKDKHEHN